MSIGQLSFTLDGQKYELDPQKLTFAEGRAVEKVTGSMFNDLIKTPSLAVMQAFVWVAVKRVKPETKFSDLDDLAIADVVMDDAASAEPDPTQAAPAA